MLIDGALAMDLGPLLATLEVDGYSRLGRVLDDTGRRALCKRAEELMLGQVSYPGLFFQLDAPNGRYEDAPLGLGWQGPSSGYRKLEKLELDPLFSAWLSNPLFERIARARIAGAVAIYRAVLFNKGTNGGSEVPWHQDAGQLWGLSREPELQIWTALDDAPEGGGCLEFVPGSHARGLVTPLGGVIPEAEVSRSAAEQTCQAVPVEAGEALLIDNRVWHRSRRGQPGRRRLAFSVCYMSAAATCLRKRREPRKFMTIFPAGARS